MLLSNRPSDCAKILHACADRDEISSHLKKIAPTPIYYKTHSYWRPSTVRREISRPSSEGVYKSAMRMRLFPSFANFAFGGNVTLSNNLPVEIIQYIGILMTSYRAFQTRQRPVARYVLFTSRAVHVGKLEFRSAGVDKSDNAMRRFAFWGPVTSDRAQIWHACADRYSHLKKNLTHPTRGGFRGLSIVKNLSRRTTPKFGTHARIDTLTLKIWPNPPQGGLEGYLLLKIFRDVPRPNLARMCG